MSRKAPKKGLGRALPLRILQVGDRVMPEASSSVYEITRVSRDGATADICFERTNLERLREPECSLKFL